ncbi:MAG: VCBS repeat-containing protein [Planctomycetes bacterium]|nr:VCBS repeat-containing protein [Planctomycetota bacterium]
MRPIASTLLALLFSTGLASAQVQFTHLQDISVGTGVPGLFGEYTQFVDVTGDGVLELVTVQGTQLVVHAWDGVAPFVEIASSALPSAGTLAGTADFDGDGALDAVVRGPTGYHVMSGDGLGGFTLAVSHSTSADDGIVLIGEFNGDGNPDIATAWTNGGPIGTGDTEIAVRLNDGAGSFGAPNVSAVPVGLTYSTVMDLDEDGIDDFVLSGLAQLTFAFSDGTGSLLFYAIHPAGAGDAPQDIRSVDMNGDGHLDIIFTCPVLGRVGVLLQDGTGELGTFADYQFDDMPIGLRASDLDGDGDEDLVVTTLTGVGFRLGDGSGTFGPSQSLPMALFEPRIALADVDADGDAEFALRSGGVMSIYANTAGSSSTEFRRGDINGDGQVQVSDAVALLGALFVAGSDPVGCDDAADANDDGATDLSDAVTVLQYLFITGAAAPPAPGAENCGADPTSDGLGCVVTACP